MRPVLAFPAAATLALLLAGCNEDSATPPAPPRPVLSVVVDPQSGRERGYAGVIEPRYHTDLGFRVLGRIIARDVNVGDLVKAGQQLAALDPQISDFTVRSLEASLSNARAQLANTDATLQRQTTLLAQKIASQADFDSAQQAQQAAAAAVTQAEANLAKAREQHGYNRLDADSDGVVTAVDAEVGQTVAAGQTVVSVARPDVREAVVDLGDDEIAALPPGAAFKVTLQIDPSVETAGRVREIAPQADATTRTRRVRIALDDPPAAFRLGTTVTATPKVVLASSIRLPATAILERDGGTFVWVVDEARKSVRRVPVRIGRRADGTVEIAGGLDAGARVVTAGVHSLTDGQAVRFGQGDML